MSYYRGDYYRGDYYRGDPFIGTVLRGAARFAAPVARAVGRRVGAAGRALLGMRGVRTAATLGTATGVGVAAEEAARTIGRRAVDVVVGPTGGGSPNYAEGTETGSGMVVMGAKGMCPPGFHPNKSDGPRGPKGSYCVRNRRMNPLNPRALRRALRRSEDFEAIAKRTVNTLRSGPRKFKKV
jgi:hypothetical protein